MLTDKNPKLKLVLVTKGRSAEEVLRVLNQAEKSGRPIGRIAENRLDEAEEKFHTLEEWGSKKDGLEKHFIGKLQARKIPDLVRLFDVIQSVETFEQAQKISHVCEKLGKNMDIFVEINVSGLAQRSGVSPEEASDLINRLQKLPNLRLRGVMGMATPDSTEARAQFRLLKRLQGDLEECSMGMSGDFRIAVEEGSTLLRLGRVVFEEGLPPDL